MELFEIRPNFAILVELVVVIGSEVMKWYVIFENVVNCNQHGMSYREIGSL